jgi:hypothetical protein
MAFTQNIIWSLLLSEPGGATQNFNWTDTDTDSGSIEISEAIADATTDGLVAFALDISEIASFAMWSDQALLIETNDGTTPGDSITLVANQPLLYSASAAAAFGITNQNPFSVDITALYVTNSSGSTANLEIRVVYDATV